MTALSIRHQRFTLREREVEQARKDAEWYEQLPAEVKAIPYYYWHVEHKPKRSWKFLCDFYGSEEMMAAMWLKHFGTKPNYRLICFSNYLTQTLVNVNKE